MKWIHSSKTHCLRWQKSHTTNKTPWLVVERIEIKDIELGAKRLWQIFVNNQTRRGSRFSFRQLIMFRAHSVLPCFYSAWLFIVFVPAPHSYFDCLYPLVNSLTIVYFRNSRIPISFCLSNMPSKQLRLFYIIQRCFIKEVNLTHSIT